VHKISKISELIKENRHFALIDCWKKTVGQAIAQQTIYRGCAINPKTKKMTLFIGVADLTWRMELIYQKTQILEKYQILYQEYSIHKRFLPKDLVFMHTGKRFQKPTDDSSSIHKK